MAYKTIIGTMKTAGTLDISSGDIDLAAGSVDNADLAGSIANSKLANDSVTVSAGNGLSGGGEVDLGASVALALDLNELTAVQIASGDFLPLVDASDNSTKKESIDDIATLFAGDGLAASSAVLAVQVSGAVQVASDKVGIAAAFAGNGLAASGSSTHIAALSLDLNELSAAAVDVANDSFAMLDATDNSSKKESIADLMTAVAGNGLKAASGVLAMDLNELTEATIDRANDYVIFIDADDSNSTKKESFADLAAKLADGDGIEASSGKLSVKVDDSTVEIDTDTVRVKAAGVNVSHLNSAVAGNGLQGGAGSALALDLNELTAVQIASGDFLPLVDASDNSTKKESIDDIATLFAGDGLGASSAVLSVQVSGAMSVSSDKVGLKASIAGAGLAASGSSNHMEVLSLDLSEYSRVDIAAGDHFLVLDSDGATEQLERVDKFSDFLAGDGLEASSGVMAVKVDDSSIEINSDTVRVKASGVTNAMLANSAISVAGQSISLGGSATALTGLTDLDVGSAGNFTFFDTVGANTLTLGAATSTVKVAGDLEVGGTLNTVSTTELLVEDKTIQVARGAADSSAADGAGLKIDGSDKSITWSHSDQAFKVDADLYAAAGLSGRLHAITADTTLSQGHFLVKVSTSGGAVTVTLPSSMPTGKVFVIKDAGAASSNAITIATAGSETIDGAASIQIISNYGAANLMFDGSNYLVW